MILSARMAEMAEQNAAMRVALDIIREHEFLRDSLSARGLLIEAPKQTMAAIAEVVAARHSCTVAELRSATRDRRLAWPRQEAMWLIRQITTANGQPRYSLTQIGRFFGDRDHATVLHAVRAHEARALAQQETAA